MSNPYKQLGGQALIYGMGNVLPRVLNYAVLTFYYTRRFAIEEYGVITELYAYVAIMLIVLTYGMETGLFRFSSQTSDRQVVYNTNLISVMTSSLVFFLIILLFSGTISCRIGYCNNPEYIIYLGGILSLDAVGSIAFAKLRVENKVRKFAMLKILNVAITIMFVLFFLEVMPAISFISNTHFYRMHLENIGVGYVLIANLIASAFILLFLMGEIKVRLSGFDLGLLKKMLIYSLPLLISGLAGQFNESLDRILLRNFTSGSLDPLYELGIYGANYRIAVLMTLFVQMFRYAAEPFFFNRSKESDSGIVYANILKYFTIFMMVIFLAVTLFIDFTRYIIPENYFGGLKIVPVVLFANLLVGMLFNVNMWYKLSGQTMYGVAITGVGAIITIVLNVIFIPRFSYIACAWTHLICNAVMLALTYYYGRKYYKIPYDLKRIGIYIGLGLLFFTLFTLLRSEKILLNFILATVLLGIYIVYCNHKEKLIGIFTGYGSKN